MVSSENMECEGKSGDDTVCGRLEGEGKEAVVIGVRVESANSGSPEQSNLGSEARRREAGGEQGAVAGECNRRPQNDRRRTTLEEE